MEDATRVVRRYELFPLYTRAADQPAERAAGRRYLLSARVGGEQRSEIVRLQPIARDPRCDSPGLEQASNFELVVEADPLRIGSVAQQFAGARLLIAPGTNPKLQLKAIVPELLTQCGLPVTVTSNCPRPTGREFCQTIYAMHENGADFRGAAVPGAGAVSANGGGPQPVARFTGALTLRALPVD